MANSGQRLASRAESQGNGRGNDGNSRPAVDTEPSSAQEGRMARERAAVFERVLSSVSHALGTPLQVISGRAAMIRMDATDDDIREHARIVERKVQDITQLMQRLLEFARGSDFEAYSCNLADATRDAAELVKPLAASRGVTLTLSLNDATCAASHDVAVLMVTDLLTEAIQRSAEHGTLAASVQARDGESGGALKQCAEFSLRADAGTFDESVSDRAHEPWMKPDPGDRDGALRIALAFGLLRRLGGWSRVQNAADGVTITFCLPRGN